MVIGICGGSGSGKTTLLERLVAYFGDLKPTSFTMDNYYKPIEQQLVDENGEVNFDLPTALDKDKLVADFNTLLSGQAITVKEYHFNTPPDSKVFITLTPSPIIIIEGLFVFHYEEIRNKLDFSIFMDVENDTQLERRILRDKTSRGYTKEAILYQWNNHVMPCFEKYLAPYKTLADYIFVNEHDFEEEFQKVIQVIENTNEFKEIDKVY